MKKHFSDDKKINNQKKVVLEKVKSFSKFIEGKESINLILGSSITNHALRPKILGKNWYSFSNIGQNIYESYKFIDYYKNSVVIDTLIVGLQPFDFPFSYTKNRLKDRPLINGYFSIFGEDSITNIFKDNFLLNLELFKKRNFYLNDINKLFQKKKIEKIRKKEIIEETNDFRVLNFHIDYFHNVKDIPNLKYFNLFNNLADSLESDVIYLLTPKHKVYSAGMKNYNYDILWESIIDSVIFNSKKFWNYENMVTDTFNFNWFNDETHINYRASKQFSKIIKERLNN